MSDRIFHVLIKEICKELNISVKTLSFGWILELSRENKIFHITGNRFDINPEASGLILCDKYATYEILKSNNIPVIEHKMVFNPKTRKEFITSEMAWNNIESYFNINKKLVVKPNSGCEGLGVYYCTSLKQLRQKIGFLFKRNDSISLCPFYKIETEYRIFYLNGCCELIYGKIPPFVIGDGINCVKKLIELLNLPNNKIVKDNLNMLDLNYIPKIGEKIDISWKFNLSGGAVPFILKNSSLKNELESLAKKVAKLLNINFATIDIIKTVNDELYVMEANSGICMTNFINHIPGGYNIAKNIYSKALKSIFD